MCQSPCCQHVLGTRMGKRKTDGTVCLGRLVKGVRNSQSGRNHESPPQSLIVLYHPPSASGAAQPGRSHNVLSCKLPFYAICFCFLLKQTNTTPLAYTKWASSRDASVSRPGLSDCLPTAPGSRSVSNQQIPSEGQSCHY